MSSPHVPQSTVCFGEFTAELEERELFRNGSKVRLQGQPFEILAVLLEHPGRLVTRDELRQRLWPSDTFVDFEHGLNAAVNRLREALDDSAEEPRFIETLPRRGYRFIAAIDRAAVAVAQTVPERRHDRAHFRDWRLFSAIAGVSLVLVTVFGILFWASRHRRQPIAARSTVKIFPLTGAIGAEQQPAFSPDGTRVAYVWQGETQGNSNLYVKLIGAGRPLRLTSNTEQESFPVWSPDGLYIALLRKSAEGSDVYIVPALGGSERKLAHSISEYSDGGLSWSPDGKVLAIPDKTTADEPLSIFFIAANDGRKWKVTSPPADSFGDSYPVFSPDGHYLAFIRCRGALPSLLGADEDIFLQDIGGNVAPNAAPRRLTFDNVWLAGLDWTAEGRSIVFSSIRSGSVRLWRIDLQGLSQPRYSEVVPAGDDAIFPVISRKLDRLAYQQLKYTAYIYELELSPNPKKPLAKRFCPSSQGDVSPQFSPDGTKVVFASFRSGNFELWVCKSDGSSPSQLTSLGSGMLGSPTWSPDGQKIAFDHSQGGSEIRVLSLEQNQNVSVRVTPPDLIAVRPVWSGDGQWIYFSAGSIENRQVWRVPSDGGAPKQITQHGGWEGRESPDGRYVYYVKYYADWLTNPARTPGIWKIPVGGGEETRLLEHGKPGLWTVTRRGIYLLNPLPRGPMVEFFNFTTQHVTRIVTLPEDTRLDTESPAFTVSPDGRTVLYGQATLGGNIMVVENFR